MIDDLWVVIPTYNRADDLLACLGSLLNAQIVKEQIIVVDNHSQDETVEQMYNLYPEITLIRLDENLGAARASNAGFDFALKQGAEFILRLDSDTEVDAAFALRLLEAAKENPQAGILSPKIYYYDPPVEIWYAGAEQHKWHFGAINGHRHEKDLPENSQLRVIDYAWGAAMLIRREVLQNVTGFDPDFFVYYEEVDFCLRVKELGYKLLFVPDSYVWHKVGSSANNDWTAFNWNRSKMMLYRKHAKSKLHLFTLYLYAFTYALITWLIYGKTRNRGPIKSAIKGLQAGAGVKLKTKQNSR